MRRFRDSFWVPQLVVRGPQFVVLVPQDCHFALGLMHQFFPSSRLPFTAFQSAFKHLGFLARCIPLSLQIHPRLRIIAEQDRQPVCNGLSDME